MNTISNLFWGFFGLLALIALIDVAADPSTYTVAPSASRAPGCMTGTIRVSAPYDLRRVLAKAERMVRGVVHFVQVDKAADVSIHAASFPAASRLAESEWGGRRIWIDFAKVPPEQLSHIILHEISHNAGMDDIQEGEGNPCDLMNATANDCPGGPIVRDEYLTALQNLAQCAGREGK